MSTPKRHVGQNGPSVDAISVGLMSLGHAYGHAGDTPTRLKYLDDLYDLNVTWDDADIYGDTEDLVGQWLAANPDKREKIFLTSKCAFTSEGIKSDPEYVMAACEQSLKKMKTDYLDLFYIHRVDGKTPIEKTMEALVQLKKQGKIRQIGLSEVSARTLRRASAVDKVDALQIEYSPFALDIEKPSPDGGPSVLDTCKEFGITIFAYSPLGRGFLTGSFKKPEDMATGFRGQVPTFIGEAFEKNMEIVHAIAEITETKKKSEPEITQAQVVLAWILKQWDGIIPLFGSKNIGRVKENLASLNVKLTEEENQAIRRAAESLQKIGDRYPAGYQEQLNGDTPEL